MSFTRNVILGIALGGLLTQCSPESPLTELGPQHHLPTYSTWEEVNQLSQEVANYSLSERQQWEKSRGMYSIGRKMDEAILELYRTPMASAADLYAYVANHSELLSIEEEGGEATVVFTLEDNPHRYLTNAQGIYQVGEHLVRELPHGRAYMKADNPQALQTLANQSATTLMAHPKVEFRESIKVSLDPKTGIMGKIIGMEANSENGNERTCVESYVKMNKHDDQDPYDIWTLSAGTSVSTYFKTFGIWVPAERTKTACTQVRADNPNPWNGSAPVGYLNAETDFHFGYTWTAESYIGLFAVANNNNPNFSFTGAYSWGASSSAPPALLNHNSHLLGTINCPDPFNLCANVNCGPGLTCVNGDCINPCSGVICAPGYVCVNGNCQNNPLDDGCGNSCPLGYVCRNGDCIGM